MSIHKSLRTAGALVKHRNVLTREERLRKLEEEGRWDEAKDTPLGIPKVRSIKKVGRKKKKKEEEAEAEAAAESTTEDK